MLKFIGSKQIISDNVSNLIRNTLLSERGNKFSTPMKNNYRKSIQTNTWHHNLLGTSFAGGGTVSSLVGGVLLSERADKFNVSMNNYGKCIQTNTWQRNLHITQKSYHRNSLSCLTKRNFCSKPKTGKETEKSGSSSWDLQKKKDFVKMHDKMFGHNGSFFEFIVVCITLIPILYFIFGYCLGGDPFPIFIFPFAMLLALFILDVW